jgi:glyoxylase-like metal-dependent hydrolase (beta-lactamase superfamily II)
MRIRKTGKIRDHLWLFGHETSGVYLLEGRTGSIIISGGVSCIAPAVFEQMKNNQIDESRITKILILHSHFDHVGIVPYLKRSNPDIDIYASERAWEILSMPKAIDTINAFNHSVTEQMGMTEACSGYDLDWRDDISGIAVHEGDEIDLGDMKLQLFETPGHSSCSIAAYEPEIKALFPSDGGGIPFEKIIITSGNSNFSKFQKSLKKLKDLEVAYYCADHYGYVVGREARDFILRSIQAAEEHRTMIEKAYLRSKDIDVATQELVTSFYNGYQNYFLPKQIFEGVYRQMVKHIAEVIDGGA